MDKVYITKEQADEIKKLLISSPMADIVEDHSHGAWEYDSPLNKLDVDTLIRALYIGYKIEPTQDDRILEAFSTFDGYDGFYGNSKEEIDAFQAGIITVLEILQKKVIGVTEGDKQI